jgi:hypothetical protein
VIQVLSAGSNLNFGFLARDEVKDAGGEPVGIASGELEAEPEMGRRYTFGGTDTEA